MATFHNKDLGELAHQLNLSPKSQRAAQIRGIESVLAVVDPDKAYPYDMVCFRVTGYRNRRGDDKCVIPGDVLIADLVTMGEFITRKGPVPVDQLAESIQEIEPENTNATALQNEGAALSPYFTHEELAEHLSVSTKTIRRWRKRGLLGLRAMFEDGVSRLIYLNSTVERFTSQNGGLVRRGAAFRQLTSREKERIVHLAREILKARREKLHVVAREVSQQTGRAVETVRYTLRRFDEAHPQQALFAGDGHPSASPVDRAIWQAYRRGDAASVIAQDLEIPANRVQKTILEMRVRELKSDPITYVYNELFDAPHADALILDAPHPPSAAGDKPARAPRDLPAYLRKLYDIPLLSPEQEADLFRRYNYLKHKAWRLVESLDPQRTTQRDLSVLDQLQADAEDVRRRIVEANLRLVVSIARRHGNWTSNFFETVSDGNMSLMRAVEKFDFARGFKFSTYASWAIIKNYARTIPAAQSRKTRFVTGQDEFLEAAADHRDMQDPELDRGNLTRLLKEGMSDLTDRERTIVTAHFGLFGTKESSTLEQLGDQFGVTKERIRQIERRAIGKIKASISPELADLLVD